MSKCEHVWKIGMDDGVYCAACMQCLPLSRMLNAYRQHDELEAERDFYRQDSVELAGARDRLTTERDSLRSALSESARTIDAQEGRIQELTATATRIEGERHAAVKSNIADGYYYAKAGSVLWWMARYDEDAHAITCVACGAWLSLGPANDEPAEVQVEIRAAELAAQWAPMDRTVYAERDGWAWHKDGHIPEQAAPDIGTYDQRLAGYLARVIATHDATHEHEGNK